MNIIDWYSLRSREKKLDFFFSTMNPSREDSLLDIGGGEGIAGEFDKLYGYFSKVYVLNINDEPVLRKRFPNIEFIVGDATISNNLPDADFVFSNAVIEHLGGSSSQLAMAENIRRKARLGFFVTTPNYWFPFEPHFRMPFWQYLPKNLKRSLSNRFSIGNYRKGEWEDVFLLSKHDFRQLFPEATIVGMKTLFPIPPTLVAYHRKFGEHSAQRKNLFIG